MAQKVITDFSGYVFVRGIPVLTEDVVEVQKRVGAQLFDESVFQGEKMKAACIQVIKQLDVELSKIRQIKRNPLYIPEDTMERAAFMAVERGKLGDLLLDNVGSKLGPIAAATVRVIEKMPPWKIAMANQKIKSKFVGALLGQVRKQIAARS